jgi:hypothetical protein
MSLVIILSLAPAMLDSSAKIKQGEGSARQAAPGRGDLVVQYGGFVATRPPCSFIRRAGRSAAAVGQDRWQARLRRREECPMITTPNAAVTLPRKAILLVLVVIGAIALAGAGSALPHQSEPAKSAGTGSTAKWLALRLL